MYTWSQFDRAEYHTYAIEPQQEVPNLEIKQYSAYILTQQYESYPMDCREHIVTANSKVNNTY